VTDKIVQEHLETLNVKAVMVTPSHPDRVESAEFRKSKERLKEDGHYKCFICEKTDNIQIHHFAVEYSEQELADLDKVKEFVETFDIYGYGKLLKNKPLTSVEDCRCLMAVCQEHHTGTDSTDGGTSSSIHGLPFPYWIMQKLAKDGLDPIPQEGETIEFVEEKIKEFIDKEVSNEQIK